MKYFLKSAAFKIICGMVLIVSGIILYTASNPNNNIFLNAFSFVTIPFQKMMWNISNASNDFYYQFEEKEKLVQENENLKSEISKLRELTVDYYSIRSENLRLEKYYDIKQNDPGLKFISASVVGKDTTDLFADFVIDKGSESGVCVNDAIITENGLVGRICQVSSNASRVKSILSPDCKISILNSRTRDSGVISGTVDHAVNNLTRMIFIAAQNDMQSDDIVVTTGISGIYPKNLKIGKIRSIEYDDYESSYYALVEPFEDIRKIEEVFIVTDFNGKGAINILENSNDQGDK